VAPIPADLLDRRVEITGPVDRKMIDQCAQLRRQSVHGRFRGLPILAGLDQYGRGPDQPPGSLGRQDRLHRSDFRQGLQAQGQARCPDHPPARLASRPRRHIEVDGEPASGALVDFGLYLFHNAKAALAQGSGPYFYLPKLESHLEARLWNDVFVAAQSALGLKLGTIKATVLIETLPAAFEMDEILYELREHMAGLNCGRWDYIFSFIKKLRPQQAPSSCPTARRS
jgi:malate synthase